MESGTLLVRIRSLNGLYAEQSATGHAGDTIAQNTDRDRIQQSKNLSLMCQITLHMSFSTGFFFIQKLGSNPNLHFFLLNPLWHIYCSCIIIGRWINL